MGAAEISTVLLVGGDIVNMTVGVTGGYALSRVCLAGGGTVSMVAEVTEGVTFSVFCACIGEGRRGGVGLCTFIVLI